MTEIWQPIPEFDGYEASNLGRIRSLKQKNIRVLSVNLNQLGYHRVKVSLNGVEKQFCVHKLVAYAYLPNPNNYTEVDHLDKNKSNNTLSNLKWVSRSENLLNRNKIKNTQSKYKGVSLFQNKYRVRAYLNKKCFNIGLFDDEIEAATAYDNYIKSNNMPNRTNKDLGLL